MRACACGSACHCAARGRASSARPREPEKRKRSRFSASAYVLLSFVLLLFRSARTLRSTEKEARTEEERRSSLTRGIALGVEFLLMPLIEFSYREHCSPPRPPRAPRRPFRDATCAGREPPRRNPFHRIKAEAT